MKMNYNINIKYTYLPFMACVWLLAAFLFLQGCTGLGDEFPSIPKQFQPRTGKPSSSPNPSDPFVDYQEVLDLRIKMQEELERLTQSARLNLSQVRLIEKSLQELSDNHNITRSGLEKI